MSVLSHDPSIDFAIGARAVAIRYLRTCQGRVVHLNWIVISASRSSVSPLAVSLTRSHRKGSTHERAATEIIPRSAFLRSLSVNRSNVKFHSQRTIPSFARSLLYI